MATATAPRVPFKTSAYWPGGLPGHNYRQAAFLAAPHREILFGGAAGPGKTMGLLLAALQYVEVPGYSAILIRRTYRQLTLPGQLLDKARSVLRGKGPIWNDKESRYDFPSGARIVFGHLDSERDLEDALGPEYQFIGFDELTQFPEHHYLELFGRLRRPADPADPLSHVPLRMRGASNPGGRGHKWVKQRFMVDGDPSRLFIPARLADNPGIDAESYIANLMELSPQRRRQMLDGDWDARPAGAIFDRDQIKVIDADEVPPPQRLRVVRYWDEAASEPTERYPDPDYTVGLKLAQEVETADLYVLDVRRFRHRAGEVKKRVRQTAREDGTAIPVAFEQEPGASGKKAIEEWARYLGRWSVKGVPATRNKVVRAGPVASRAGLGKLHVLSAPWTTPLLDELEEFPDGHDDQVDALSGAYGEIAGGGGVAVIDDRDAPRSEYTDLLAENAALMTKEW